MKKIIITLIFLIGFSSIQSQVIRLSENRIKEAKCNAAIQEKRRKMALGVAGLAVAGTGGYVLYTSLFKGPSNDEKIEALIKRVKKLSKNNKNGKHSNKKDTKDDNGTDKKDNAQQQRQQPSVSWGSRLKGGVFNLMNQGKNGVVSLFKRSPYIATTLVNYAIWSNLQMKAFEFMSSIIPDTSKLGSYLFSSRTISWTIENNTSFERELIDLLELTSKYEDSNKRELQAITAMLVVQIEKVLGFMLHLQDKINSEHFVAKLRSQQIIESIKKLTNSLCDEVDNLIETKNIDDSSRESFVQLFQKLLFDTIGKMESYSSIELLLELDSEDSEEIFKKLKFIVSSKPNVDSSELEKIMDGINPEDLENLAKMFGNEQ